MARLNIKIKTPDASTFRGWVFVLVAGVVLAVLAVIDGGGLDELRSATGSTGCQLAVATDQLNVRSEPSAGSALVDTLTRGAVVDATRVVTDGFRELDKGGWAANQFLTPLPDTTCG